MPLKDELKQSLVIAAKARDQVLLDTLRSIQSALKYKEIDKRGELTEVEGLAIVQMLCKQHRESIDQFQKGGRADLVEKETRELQILQKFLPQQLSREEIEVLVKKAIAEAGAVGPADTGKVMKLVMKEVVGRTDGNAVSAVVKSILK